MVLDFASLIAPLSPDDFLRGPYQHTPLHIPAPEGSRRGDLLSWQRLNDLMAILPHWTESNVKLVSNSRPIPAEFYIEQIQTSAGPVMRASAARIESFLAMGASLVADAVQEIDPETRGTCLSLADALGGLVGANIYCSYPGIQAFASHYDLSEVFVLQCEGEKDWRIYANREDNPVETPPVSPDAQYRLDARKGPVRMQIRMRPGDVLYIPRGFYHDALATHAPSLHLTFSVFPLYGRILFRILEEQALRDSDFRTYLPDARSGDALDRRLDRLAEKIADLVRSPIFRADVATAQARLRMPEPSLNLPDLPQLQWFAATGAAAKAIPAREGWMLDTASNKYPLKETGEAAEWILTRPAFSDRELYARFRHVQASRLQELIKMLLKTGIFAPCDPPAP